jgi:hypothetical protein
LIRNEKWTLSYRINEDPKLSFWTHRKNCRLQTTSKYDAILIDGKRKNFVEYIEKLMTAKVKTNTHPFNTIKPFTNTPNITPTTPPTTPPTLISTSISTHQHHQHLTHQPQHPPTTSLHIEKLKRQKKFQSKNL